MSLKLAVDGRQLVFRPDGNLAVETGGVESVRGAWRSEAREGEPRQSLFRYTLDGAEQQPLTAHYEFTRRNQLRVTLEAGDGSKSDPADLVGGIEVDDRHDIIYRLRDAKGAGVNHQVTLYGELGIEENTNKLVIRMPDGTEAKITGERGIKSLEAAQNRIHEFAADDLLRFRATTHNEIEDGSELPIPAKLDFAGSWDIQNGQLVFLSKVLGEPSRPEVQIGFAGKLGAVTAGFVYFADAAGKRGALEIRGQHVWRAGDTTTEFNWQSSLGFSDKKLSAKVEFDASRKQQDGNRITLGGNMTLLQADGGPLTMNLELAAEYTWQENALVFKALVNNAAGNFNYDLMLEGRFRFEGGTIQFGIRYSNGPGADSGLTIDLAAAGDKDSAIQSVAFQLRLSPEDARMRIEASLELRMRFVAGVGRVLEQTATAPA